MKRNNNSTFFLLMLLASIGFFPACDSFTDFGNTNVDPNRTNKPVTAALITNAIAGMGAAFITEGLYCQYFAQSQYTDGSLYSRVEGGFGSYSGVLYDLQNVIINNTDANLKTAALVQGSNANQIAVSRILKAYYFARLTDYFGDIPYSQALTGEVKPVYDSQQTIYNGIFKELDEAVKQFDGGVAARGDILFSGNITRWKKFANSLRLILAIRLSKADAATGATQAKAALAADGGIITANADNTMLNYPGGNFNNPWYAAYLTRQDQAISEIMVKMLNERSDPRINSYATADKTGKITGIPYGLPREQAIQFTNANPTWSFVLAPTFRAAATPLAILTAADVTLARAEAASMGWTTENSEQLYKDGIKLSMEYWKVFTQASYDTYTSGALVAFAAGDNAGNLEKIRMQRWFTFYPDGLQGWSEWRRTNVPALKPTPFAINSSKQIIRRYIYPATEATLNGANYGAAVSKISGGDTNDGKVWWDK
ncbi:MAG: hypothetical protein RLZZ417_3153 [Bacteroidota bacterium]|jgi:hypothetical protein